MIDPKHPNPEMQLEIFSNLVRQKALTIAERQAKYREEQKKLGRRSRTFMLTSNEQYEIERLIYTMREYPGSVPAMMRDNKGRLFPVDR